MGAKKLKVAAEDVDVGAVLADRGGDLERLADDHARRLAPEVLVCWAIVHGDVTLSEPNHHARDRRLALSGSLEHVRFCTHRVLSILQVSGTGFCALCGWSGPA